MNQRTLNIWGSEIKAIQDKSIAVVKANEKLTGYDWMVEIKERYKEENEKREKAKLENPVQK